MPVIGVPSSCGYEWPQIRYIGIIRGLAQRNKGRKTSYFEDYFLKTPTAIGKEAG